MPGQVKSGHQSGFVDPTSKKFAIMSEIVFHVAISSLEVFITIPECLFFLSPNFYIGELRLGQSRDLYITSLWENNEMRPASTKRVKTGNHSILSGLWHTN